ncbi:MAG: YqiA/YcfP family alpha/beta fold hydrolase [Casimicrobiaceae bacterium]
MNAYKNSQPRMVTIVYLHGFRSSPASEKAQAMRRHVDAMPVATRPRLAIPELDHAPRDAMRMLLEWIEREVSGPLALVGSSLGGYYATYLAEKFGARAVLVNPAVTPYDDLAVYVGPQTNLYTGRVFDVLPAHFDELRALDVGPLRDPSRYLVYLQTGDEVLDWRVAAARYGGAWQCVEGGGDHGFAGFERHMPTILRFAAGEFARGADWSAPPRRGRAA